MNRYESGLQKIIPAVLIYVFHEDHVLMLHRNDPSKETTDFHHGKWNGLGGKLELGESPLIAAVRELKEESGINLPPQNFKNLGSLFFPNFKPHKNEDWWVSIYSVDLKAKPRTLNSVEGSLSWVEKKEIFKLNLWEGDLIFLPHILDKKSVSGTFWYENKKLAHHEIEVRTLNTFC